MEYVFGVLTGMVTMNCLKIILQIAYLRSPEFHGEQNKICVCGGGIVYHNPYNEHQKQFRINEPVWY